MKVFMIVLLVIAIILLAGIIVLYILGKRAEKRKAEQDAQVEAAAQSVTMLIIDKKRLRVKEAGLPDAVAANMPFYARRMKLPIVKAKVGPRSMNFICEESIFDDIPVKKEVKARVSGLYITSVRGLHGKNNTADDGKKKKGFRAWAARKNKELRAEQKKK